MYEAFVYKWTNKKNEMYYIGKHKGAENDGYVSSGQYFLSSYVACPDNFYREILFRGTDKECLNEEQKLIRKSIFIDGHEKLYNRTTWSLLKEWKLTCQWCNNIVDPRNTIWLRSFSMYHFENCAKNPKNPQHNSGISLRKIEREINKLLDINTKENNFRYADEIRTLRIVKKNLLK